MLYYKIETKKIPENKQIPKQTNSNPYNKQNQNLQDEKTYSNNTSQDVYKKSNMVESSEFREFYEALVEDKFSNLSIENKLLFMHKTAIIRSRRTNNYILMCLALLIIIALKIYSK